MLLGRNLVPFTTPPEASGAFRPSMPHMHFYSNMRPFDTMAPMRATSSAWYPTAQNAIGPAPSMPPAPAPVTPGAAASPVGPAAAMHGAFGSTGGVRAHFHMNPYTVMRNGLIPGVHPNASHIRHGVRTAGAWIEQSMPFQTRALPPPPPPPPPPPAAVAPGGTKGFFGALFGRPMHRRARHRHWWQWSPPSTQEQAVAVASNDGCEWIADAVSGISKQICNGHVVAYKDAQGNVQRPGEYNAYPETGMSGLGFPPFGFRPRHHRHGFHPRHHRHGIQPGFRRTF